MTGADWLGNALQRVENHSRAAAGPIRDVTNLTHDPRALTAAVAHVLKGGKAPGVDGVTVSTLRPVEWGELVVDLAHELKNGTYRPLPLRLAYVRSGGRTRPIAVPALRDRVAQTPVRLLLESVTEPRASGRSFGFHAGRGPHAAVGALIEHLETAAGDTAFVRFDIARAFPSVSHKRLLREVRKHVADQAVLSLLKRWLRAELSDGTRSYSVTQGLVLGQPISPVLFNLFLAPLDDFIEATGASHWRYADDLVAAVPARDAAAWLAMVEQFMAGELGLGLSGSKTSISKIGDRVEFLGFEIKLLSGGEAWAGPSSKALASLERSLRALKFKSQGLDHARVLELVEARARGWSSYFLDPDAANGIVKRVLSEHGLERGT